MLPSSGAEIPSFATEMFMVWDAAIEEDRRAWIHAWESWPQREVFAHPGYAELFSGDTDRVLCATRLSGDGGILYPFIYRALPDGLSIGPDLAGAADITTPYGYGGPYAWGTGDLTVQEEFWAEFHDWAGANGVVAEFIRFDLSPEATLEYPGVKVARSRNIVRSLDLDDDAMWMDFEQKVRKNVKKALRSGVTIEVDESGEHLSQFLTLYHGTMERRDAADGYYFPRDFFESIHRELPGQFAYFHAYLNGAIVSTELVLVSERSVYSFLGGTDSSAFAFRPNDLLKHEVIRWARGRAKDWFVLGGGATPEDGIERYKRSFAPDGAVDFFTGQRVLAPTTYEELVAERKSQLASLGIPWPDATSFFPAYRVS
jgi:hypothetical protein